MFIFMLGTNNSLSSEYVINPKIWRSFDVDNHVMMILKNVLKLMWSKMLSSYVHSFVSLNAYGLKFRVIFFNFLN